MHKNMDLYYYSTIYGVFNTAKQSHYTIGFINHVPSLLLSGICEWSACVCVFAAPAESRMSQMLPIYPSSRRKQAAVNMTSN